MPLYAYNKTTTAQPVVASNVTLTTIPASGSAGVRGKAWDVTNAIQPNATVDPINGVAGGRTAAELAAIQAALVATGSVEFQWSGSPQYLTDGLAVLGPAAANVVNEQPSPATPQAYVFDIADAAGNTDIQLPAKFEVHDVRGFKTGGAGGAGDTAQVLNTASAITNAISLNVADTTALAASTYDDAFTIIPAGGLLRVTIVDGNAGATDLSCRLVVSGVLRA